MSPDRHENTLPHFVACSMTSSLIWMSISSLCHLASLTSLTGLWRDKGIRYRTPSASLLRHVWQLWQVVAMFAVFAMIAGFQGNRLFICVFGDEMCAPSAPLPRRW
jgi:hypothetical protein